MSNGNGNGLAAGVWRDIALVLAAVLVSIGGAWVTFGNDTVSQAQVRNIIDTTSPYAIDRTGILARLDTDKTSISQLQEEQQTLENRLTSIDATLAKIDAELATLTVKPIK